MAPSDEIAALLVEADVLVARERFEVLGIHVPRRALASPAPPRLLYATLAILCLTWQRVCPLGRTGCDGVARMDPQLFERSPFRDELVESVQRLGRQHRDHLGREGRVRIICDIRKALKQCPPHQYVAKSRLLQP